MAKPSV